MPRESAWTGILLARTTSHAIELAADIPAPQLSDAALPLHFADLSARAQGNARAVGRALGVRVPGLEEGAWQLWEQTEEDRAFLRGRVEDQLAEHSTEETEGLGVATAGEGWEGSDAESIEEHDLARKKPRTENTTPAGPDKVQNNRATSADRTPVGNTPTHPQLPSAPSRDETTAAQSLKAWASTSPHTKPPSEAVSIICRSPPSLSLLHLIAPKDTLPDVLAPVLIAFTQPAGPVFAASIMDALIVPYVKDLKAPAPRDVMQALISFSERHWRIAVSLFQIFGGQEKPVNGAIAEVLVRTTTVMSGDGALQGLRAWCGASWGEDGIRVAEALLGKCKTQEEAAGLVVPALEKNVVGSEKSVRYGKLLFTVVRDLPGVAENFKDQMESICGRSSAFLARRALKVLHEKLSKL